MDLTQRTDSIASTRVYPEWTVPKQLIALAPGLVFLSAFVLRAGLSSNPSHGLFRFTLFDDAMISMTYARTLAETGEWVWFPGAERVQGFTNPLWTLYMSLWHGLGFNGSEVSLVVSLTNLLMITVSALAVGKIVAVCLGGRPERTIYALLAGAATPFIYPLAFWSLRGMEVGVLSLLLILTVLAGISYIQRKEGGSDTRFPLLLLGALGVIGVWTRLDFVTLYLPVIIFLAFRAGNFRAVLKIAVLAALPVFLAGLALLVFQYLYWADPMPNTYRLKVEGVDISDRLRRGLASGAKNLGFVLLGILSLLAVRLNSSNKLLRDVAAVLALAVLSASAYSVWVGGDAWENFLIANRYVSVSLPALVALVFIGLGVGADRLAYRLKLYLLLSALFAPVVALGASLQIQPFLLNRQALFLNLVGIFVGAVLVYIGLMNANKVARRRFTLFSLSGGALTIVLTTSSSFGGFTWLQHGAYYQEYDQIFTQAGLLVRSATSPDAVFAVHTAGAVAYYSGLPMVDLLGKSDRTIATGDAGINLETGLAMSFFPGHHKFNSLHSIYHLKPDLVMGLPDDVDIGIMSDWGYMLSCVNPSFNVFVLEISDAVGEALIQPC